MICAHNIQNKPMLLHHKRSLDKNDNHNAQNYSACTSCATQHMLRAGNKYIILNRKLIEGKPPHAWRVVNVNRVSYFVVWKHNRDKRLFHALIYRRFLFIQFTEVSRGGHQTHDHIWEESSLRLHKQTTHVDNPQIVEDKNSFLISCSVWSYSVMPCSENIPATCPSGLC